MAKLENKEIPQNNKKKSHRKIWEILSTGADVIQLGQFFSSVATPVIAKTVAVAALVGVTAGATVVAGNTIVREIRYQDQTISQGVKGDKGEAGAAGINGVSGYERLNKISADDSNYRKDVFVSCTGSKKVIGGGANIRNGDDRRTYMMQSFPDTDHSWRAGASITRPTDGTTDISWSLEAFVICADIN